MLNRSKIISSSSNSQNVTLTLPITCQICLSRVKDPCVCSNLHAFCKTCIDMWLEKSKQCPTCRVDINQENPCRRVLGGLENNDEIDQLKPGDFSNASMRKARYLSLFQQYEEEIERLCKYIDSLNDEISKYKDSSSNTNANSFNSENEILLKAKLDQNQAVLNETQTERDKLKEVNTKLESENSILMQDIMRLRASLSEKNSQMSNRYTVAALETKIESYEKEIKQLQKALDKSDKYIADLEQKLQTSPSASSYKLADNKTNDSFNSDNSTSKNVKFSDKIDTIHLKETSLNNENQSLNASCLTGSAKKLNIIPKDNFYGSPSKTPNKTPNKMTPSKALANNESINKISSFSDRLKMMNNSASNTTSVSEASSSITHNNPTASLNADQQLLLGNSERATTVNANTNVASNWFSPMKRLRIEETPNETATAYVSSVLPNLPTYSNLNTCTNQVTSDQSYNLLLLDSNSNSASSYLENISNIPTTTYFNPNMVNFNFASNQPNFSVPQIENFTQGMFQSAHHFETNSNPPRADNF